MAQSPTNISSNTTVRFLRSFLVHIPISAHGALLIGLGLLLVLGPARAHYDIVAATVGALLLVVALSFMVSALISAFRFSRSNLVNINIVPGSSAEITAGERNNLLLSITHSTLLYLTSPVISVRLSPQLISNLNINIGRRRKVRKQFSHPITFPHRGIWRFESARCEMTETLAIASVQTKINSEDLTREIKVYPKHFSEPNLPILTSTERVGDELTAIDQRMGDPLDWKQYHPSDGANRILWKSFARSGTLLARFQESSITPEGKLAIFVPALPNDDLMASSAISYLQKVEASGVEVFATCGGSNKVCRSSTELRDELIKSTWISDKPSEELRGNLNSLFRALNSSNNQSELKRIIVLLTPDRFRNDQDSVLISSICSEIIEHRASPVIMGVTIRHPSIIKIQRRSLIQRWFTIKAETNSITNTLDRFNQFMLESATIRGWECYRDEVESL